MSVAQEIEKKLFELQDTQYRDFQCKLIPSVQPICVIGVRTPELRKLAARLYKNPDIFEFLHDLPHKYYEEYNLHGYILEKFNDFDVVAAELDLLLPHINNWATCDSISPKVLAKYPEKLEKKAYGWLNSGDIYCIRYAIRILMTYFLDDNFKEEYLETVASIANNAYYVQMMQAWYFATALAKQYESAVPYLEQAKLDVWVHNKTIQKAVESYRITDEKKAYLKKLRIHKTK